MLDSIRPATRTNMTPVTLAAVVAMTQSQDRRERTESTKTVNFHGGFELFASEGGNVPVGNGVRGDREAEQGQ